MQHRKAPYAGAAVLHPEDYARARKIDTGLSPEARAIADEWCAACGVPLHVIRGPSRKQAAVEARQGLMWLLRHRAGMSYPQIGAALLRDHTTVAYGVRAEQERRQG